MIFAQIQPGEPVLNRRQNLISHEFVKRHPAAERFTARRHTGTKDHIGFAFDQGLAEERQRLRGILAVPVHESNDIEPSIDSVLITDLLIASVPLVYLVSVDGKLLDVLFGLVSERGEIGVVL